MSSEPYWYDLPEEKIAQRPVHPPESAKLLVIERATEKISHQTFADLPAILSSTDLLVFNTTKVLPARLFGRLDSGGEAEVLLLHEEERGVWRAVGRPLRKFHQGKKLIFGDGFLTAEVKERVGEKEVLLEFSEKDPTSFRAALEHVGTMPIPPYIRSGRGDKEDLLDYQTIFAQHEGSVAAPTASLHFSNELLERLEKREATKAELILHVGAASFLPVLREDGSIVPPSTEEYVCKPSTWEHITEHRNKGGRCIAVGTTVTRALESIAAGKGLQGGTSLFIQPGFKFNCVDALITNFHQPGTTHLLLVEALLGRELLDKAYHYALSHEFRFLSYGDGMLVL